MKLQTVSFNLRGLRSGIAMLHELCDSYSVIGVQEHWLRPDELDKLSVINCDFHSAAVSGMKNSVSSGLLTGRPFGGVGFLWHRSLSGCIEVVNRDPEGRCCALVLKLMNRTILFINVYLPCFDGSANYKSEMHFYGGYIANILESVNYSDCIIMGDFNFVCDASHCGYRIFKDIFDEYSLHVCDNLIKSDSATYVNEALGQSSCIDHFVVSQSLLQSVQSVSVIDSGSNFSDHKPIVLDANLSLTPPPYKGVKERKLYKVRWDKGSLSEYYRMSGEFLSVIPTPSIDTSSKTECSTSINFMYVSIVNALSKAERRTIPRVPCNALKPFWNEHLDQLKCDSIFWHNLWLSADKPMSGTLFLIKRSTKLKYKLAVRQAFAQHENRYDDELATHFLNKQIPEFWKTWAKKFRKNANSDVFIDGTNDGEYVANAFASHFNKVYSSAADDCHSIKRPFMSVIEEHDDNATNISNDITVELVDKCIQRLHVGKASGPDDLSSEHLKYAHPLVVVQLCSLFRTMVIHGLVPDNFGNGIIIPLLKDKTGDINSLDNYRAITLIPVISKLFELVVLELCSEQFMTDEL